MSLSDWPQPIHRRLIRQHSPQPIVAPEVTRDILQLQRIHGMPLLLQPMRESGQAPR